MNRNLYIVVILVLIPLLNNCRTTQPKTVLNPPTTSFESIDPNGTSSLGTLSDLIEVKDLRWDPVLIGRDKAEKYIELNQGFKMQNFLKDEILNILKSKRISAQDIIRQIGSENILVIAILEISIAQGANAANPSLALVLRDRKWIGLSVNGFYHQIPLSTEGVRFVGPFNGVGAKTVFGLAVFDPQSKPLFKRIITEQALEPILNGEILQNTAQKTLNKAYQNALEKLINLILSGIAIESDK